MSSRSKLVAALLGCSMIIAVGVFVSLKWAAEAAVKRAQLALATGDTSHVRSELAWVTRLWPQHPEAQYALGLASLADSDYSAAAQSFAAVPGDSVRFEEAQQKLAGSLLLSGRLQAAEGVMRKYLDRFPDSVPVRRQLGSVLIGQFREREAVEILDAGLQTSAGVQLSDRISLMQDSLAAQFNPPTIESCLGVLNDALKADPDQPTVQAAVAHGLLRLGTESEAIAVLDRLPIDGDSSAFVWLTRCRLLLIAGETGKAQELLESARSQSRGELAHVLLRDDRFFLLESEAFERAGAWQAAINSLAEASDLRPLDRHHLARRARLLQRLGRPEEAAAAYDVVHRRASAELEIWHLIGRLQSRVPTADECLELSVLLNQAEHSRESEAWKAVAHELSENQPSMESTFRRGSQH